MKSLVIIKHGSYLDVYNRVTKNGGEFYHSEMFWHDFIDKLSLKYDVTILSMNSYEHDVLLPNRVRSLGLNLYNGILKRIVGYIKISFFIRKINPYFIVIRSPEPVVLFLSLLQSKAILPMFADSFNRLGMKALIRAKLLKVMLNNRKIKYVSNHNLAACLSLSSLGIRKEKIIPWDWYYNTNNSYPAKHLTNSESVKKLIYVGKITYGKGVGEIIEAIKYLSNNKLFLTIVGEGKDLNKIKEKVRQSKLEHYISFLGKVENSRIIELMNSHDVVIVPSRKKEAEGLPVTIYEALTSKTPLICSNHPMFVYYLTDGTSASIFEESDYISLAENINQLIYSPAAYDAISANAHNTLETMICPVKIDKIIVNWLRRNNDWFKDKTLNVLCAEENQAI